MLYLGSLQDNFVWRLISVYSPNDDTLRVGLWEELENLFSLWDISRCSGGDLMWSDSHPRGQLEVD